MTFFQPLWFFSIIGNSDLYIDLSDPLIYLAP